MEYEKTQEEEMKLAAEQKRQPICTYCNHPLDTLIEYQSTRIVWTYDKQLKRYMKDDNGDGDKPFHNCSKCSCEAYDWEFIDYNLIDF
jgi:hypothetical protein